MVLNFWATWCKSCEREKAFVHDLARNYPDVQVIAILTRDPDAQNAELVDIPTAFDPEGKVATSYGVNSLPQTFLINADGEIIAHFNQSLNDTRYAMLQKKLRHGKT